MSCWPSPPFRRRRARPLRSLAAGLAIAALASAAAGEPEQCAPLEACPEDDPDASVRDPGLSAGSPPRVDPNGGAIVPLPVSGEAPPAQSLPGEALLALPKQADGTIPRDFELAPGARIADSYWSPVLCATVARIVGPATARPDELVLGLPDTALVVPHTRYSTPAESGAASAAAGASGTDPYVPLQTGLKAVGALEARPVSDGRGVVMAVLDSAADTGHRELRRVKLEMLPGGPGAQPSVHGSLIAGVIAAIDGNAFGIAGVAPGAELVVVPVCTPIGRSAASSCQLYDVLRGIDRSYELKARIFNLSLVGPANALLRRAVDRLAELGPVVVAAAGNEGTNEPRYPAAYASVIGVGAVDADGELAGLSNRGDWVQLLAPGTEILSTVPDDAFSFGSGTSLAAAHVTAVLGLLTAASGNLALAQDALLVGSGQVGAADAAPLPPVCELLAGLGHPCPSSGTSP